MPSYESLRPHDLDTEADTARKRRIGESLIRLRKGLREHFGPGASDLTGERCRVATWNLREFAKYNKFGERLDDAYFFIAEIISHFDLVALQEVRGDLHALRRVMKLLGPQWDYLGTDVTDGSPGNGERMVFVFRRNRVWFRYIAGELTLPEGRKVRDPHGVALASKEGLVVRYPQARDLLLPDSAKLKTKNGAQVLKGATRMRLPPGATLDLPDGMDLYLPSGTPVEVLSDGRRRIGRSKKHVVSGKQSLEFPSSVEGSGVLQFARTPYLAAFQCGWLTLMLCTVHIYYGEESDDSEGMARRILEIEQLTRSIAQRAERENDSDADNFFFLLGDFNIVGKQHKTMQALESNQFVVPEAIKAIPAGSNVKRDRHYDQIAYWAGERSKRRPGHVTHVEVRGAGIFDFFEHVYRMGGDDPDDIDAKTYAPLMAEKLAEAKADPTRTTRAKSWAYSTWRTYQMSDHLPMWVELEVDFADEYLDSLVKP